MAILEIVCYFGWSIKKWHNCVEFTLYIERNDRGDGGAETLPVAADDKVDDSDHESENSANESELQESSQHMPIRPTFGTVAIKMPLFMSMRIWQNREPRFSERREN